VPQLTPRASRSRLAASLVTAALAATVLTGTTPAHAAGVATAAPLRFALPGTDTATDVLSVGSEVWVSAGSSVLITSRTGQVRKTVTGILGAKGLTLSPDAQSVYVSSNSAARIVRVSAAGVILDSWTSQACPGKSAIAGGALYYAYGCTASTTGVGRLDLTSHTDASVLTSSSAQSLTAAGSRLVTYTSGGSGHDMTSYTIGGDGSLTRNASVRTGGMKGAELSPDGSQLIMTDYDHGYGVARYDAATMALNGTFATGPYPNAVAWSPDGSTFAGILDASYDSRPVQVFSAATGAAVTRSVGAGTASYWSRSGEAAWSADGKYIFSLVQGYSEAPYLIVTPAAGQVAAAIGITAKPATAYGKNVTVTIRAPKRPNTVVKVTATQNGVPTVKSLRTNGSGVATWAFPAKASGTVVATAAADLSYLAGSGTTRFATPTALTGKLVGASKVSKGVAHYSSIAKVQVNLQILPRRTGKIVVTLQHRAGGSWRTDQKATFITQTNGTVAIVLSKGARKVTYRFLAKAVADPAGGASPTMVSPSLVVD
jgi:hypothetical protein